MNKDYGKLIRQKREDIGITQKELADKLHVTDQAISNWERGFGIDSENRDKVNDLLGITTDGIFSGDYGIPITELNELRTLKEIDENIDIILSNIEVEMYPNTVKKLVKMTFYYLLGERIAFYLYYLTKLKQEEDMIMNTEEFEKIKKHEQESLTWINISFALVHLLALLTEANTNVFKEQMQETVAQLREGYSIVSGRASYKCCKSGFEIIPDFSDEQIALYYKSIDSALSLDTILPDNDTDIFVLYRMALNDITSLI